MLLRICYTNLIEENNMILRVLADKVEVLAGAGTGTDAGGGLTNVSKPATNAKLMRRLYFIKYLGQKIDERINLHKAF